MAKKKPFSGKQKKEQLKQKRQKQEQKKEKKEKQLEKAFSSDILNDDNCNEPNEIDSDSSRKNSKLSPNVTSVVTSNSNKWRTVVERDTDEDIERRKKAAHRPLNVNPTKTALQHGTNTLENSIPMPLRPSWTSDMSSEQVEKQEQNYFHDYVHNIYDQYSRSRLNYFELNLEVWRQLWRVLEGSDMFMLVTDVRNPLFHLPPSLYSYITDTLQRPLILVLNKIDLVSPHRVLQWRKWFSQHFPKLRVAPFSAYFDSQRHETSSADYTESISQAHKMKRKRIHKIQANGAQELLDHCQACINDTAKGDLHVDWKLQSLSNDEGHQVDAQDIWPTKSKKKKKSKRRAKKHSETTHGDNPRETEEEEEGNTSSPISNDTTQLITIGMIGHPNVGKTSVINGLYGKSVASASLTPGHTKTFQTLFLNTSTRNIRLMDCPGLVFPALDIPRELQILSGLFPIAQVREVFTPVRYLAERIPLDRLYRLSKLNSDGELDGKEKPDVEWTPWLICESLALKRRFFIAKSGRPDVHRAGLFILKDALAGVVVLSFSPPHCNSEEISDDYDPHEKEDFIDQTTSDDEYRSEYSSDVNSE